MCGSGKKRACCCSSSCSEKKKKRVKHEKRPLPDLNYPPPPESSSSSSSPPLPRNYDKLLGATRPHSPAAASRKRKMGMEEAESSSHRMKACWNKVMNYVISNLKNPNKRKKKDEPAQDKEE